MGLPSIFGGSRSAQFNAARTANDTFIKPVSGAAALRAAPKNFAVAMQAAAVKAVAGGSDAKQAQLQQAAQSGLNAFQQKFMQLLSENHVDLSQPVRLESDGLGGLQVAGEHPDATKIKSILQEHPELAAQFQTLATQFQQLRAMDPTKPADDPLRPVAFGITVSGQQVQGSFA